MKKYLIVIEQTGTGYSAYSPDLEDVLQQAKHARKLSRRCEVPLHFTWKGCSAAVSQFQNRTPIQLMSRYLLNPASSLVFCGSAYRTVKISIHAHPTLAEAMLDASNSVYGIAINA